MADFYALVTDYGAQAIADALAAGTTIDLTEMAVGDGGGVATAPNGSETALVNEVYRATVNDLRSLTDNKILAELVIPVAEGGWTIREVGLFDSGGNLFAIANFPTTYKPAAGEGTAREIVIRIYVQLSNNSVVNITVDPGAAFATQAWVTERFIQGPASSVNNVIPRFDGTTGLVLQSGTNAPSYDDAGLLTVADLSVAGDIAVAGNIVVGGTVDGQNLSDRLDQNVKTTDSPTFAGLTVAGAVDFDGATFFGTIAGAVTWSGAHTWQNVGTFTGAGGVSRSDAQIEFYNASGTGHAMLAGYMTNFPPNTTNEVAFSAQAKNSAGNIVQIGAFYAKWVDTDGSTGYSKVGIHANWTGGVAAENEFELIGNNGLVIFGGNDPTIPGFRGVQIKRASGKPTIFGESDIAIDANFGGSTVTDRVFLQAYHPGHVSLANGGGDLEIGPVGSEYAKVTSLLFEVNVPFRVDNVNVSQVGTANTTNQIATSSGWVRQLFSPQAGSSSYSKTESTVSHGFLTASDAIAAQYDTNGNWILTPAATSTLQVKGYTALGDAPGSLDGQNPYHKIKKFTETWPANTNSVSFSHGLSESRIKAIYGNITSGATSRSFAIPAPFYTSGGSSSLWRHIYIEWSALTIWLASTDMSGNGANLSTSNETYTIYVVYEA